MPPFDFGRAMYWLTRNRLFLFWVTAALLAVLGYLLFPVPTLTITNLCGEREKSSVAIPVSKGDKFTIKYTHSVDKLPVYESFLVNDKYNIVLSEIGFIMLGAGMSDSGDELVYDGEWTIVKNINKEMAPFCVRVSRIGEQTLFIDKRVIKLVEITPESGSLKFEIRKTPRIYLMAK